jgi:RNA polymerase primary sigma factor
MIHVPAQATAEIRRMRRVRDERQQELGRELSDGELASECGVDETRVARLFAALQDAVSYDTPVGDGQEASLLELAVDQSAQNPEAGALRESYREEVRRLVSSLRQRERNVLEQRFGLNGHSPRTLDELSQELRITREGVRQIEARAIRKLRHALRTAHWD